ncbi:MAG: hypothetical protein HY552_05420 [Elusimicrobia bacterium]|nr:hypothetical protein [Elusimicrobiota bacterium]
MNAIFAALLIGLTPRGAWAMDSVGPKPLDLSPLKLEVGASLVDPALLSEAHQNPVPDFALTGAGLIAGFAMPALTVPVSVAQVTLLRPRPGSAEQKALQRLRGFLAAPAQKPASVGPRQQGTRAAVRSLIEASDRFLHPAGEPGGASDVETSGEMFDGLRLEDVKDQATHLAMDQDAFVVRMPDGSFHGLAKAAERYYEVTPVSQFVYTLVGDEVRREGRPLTTWPRTPEGFTYLGSRPRAPAVGASEVPLESSPIATSDKAGNKYRALLDGGIQKTTPEQDVDWTRQGFSSLERPGVSIAALDVDEGRATIVVRFSNDERVELSLRSGEVVATAAEPEIPRQTSLRLAAQSKSLADEFFHSGKSDAWIHALDHVRHLLEAGDLADAIAAAKGYLRLARSAGVGTDDLTREFNVLIARAEDAFRPVQVGDRAGNTYRTLADGGVEKISAQGQQRRTHNELALYKGGPGVTITGLRPAEEQGVLAVTLSNGAAVYLDIGNLTDVSDAAAEELFPPAPAERVVPIDFTAGPRARDRQRGPAPGLENPAGGPPGFK